MLCVVFHLLAGPVPCTCRNLRIRTRVAPDRVRTRASDLRGHQAYRDEGEAGTVLILRLRQNRPPTTARTMHNPPHPSQGICPRTPHYWGSAALP